jgi:starch synthase
MHVVFATSECVPFAKTGGLADTIDEWNADEGIGTGFKFSGLSATALLEAIDRALGAFENKQSWRKRMLNGMARDDGWPQPAREYAAVYEEAASRRA